MLYVNYIYIDSETIYFMFLITSHEIILCISNE